ncbi:MAG: 6-phosphogluconolactonase [Methylobacillus sp.]|jgi:6-phosphogluconolactonase|nr:6-phosphogluconolactonase [Methylobacillus sp.]
MQAQQIHWRVFPDLHELRQAACNAILAGANTAIAAHGKFTIALAGGSTPHDIYRLLRDAKTDWAKWHVVFGDERCLPPEHPERNSLMARESLLDHVPIPRGQIHPIPAELGAEKAARAYCETLADMGEFDLVLLGMGEDAHTASLFPGHAWESAEFAAAIPVHNAPKPPPERVSLSASRLSQARQVMFFITGANKREAVTLWQSGADLPVAAICPMAGVDVYMDAAADPATVEAN